MIIQCILSESQLNSICAQEIIDAMPELLRAHRLGLHRLVFARHCVKFFLDLCDLRAAERAMLARIASDFTQDGNLSTQASVYCDIAPISQTQRSGRLIRVPFKELTPALLGTPAYLLVENAAYDGFLYTQMISSARVHLKIPRLQIYVDHGGGNDLVAVLKRRIDEGKMVACVVDSDRCSPRGPNSTKCNELNLCTNAYPIAECLVTPCKEAENFIPRDVFALLPQSKCCAWLNSSHLICSADGNEDFWLYLDLKEGISSVSYQQLSNADDRYWWNSKLAFLGVDVDEDFELPGFGETILHSLKNNDEAIAALREAVRGCSWRKYFASFIADLAWWFCASEPIRT